MTDDADEYDFLDRPLEEWIPDAESVPLTKAATKQLEPSVGDVSPRRRSRRKVIGSILVAVALIAGGITVWLLLDSGRNESDGVVNTSPVSAPQSTEENSPVDIADFPTLGLFDSFSRADSDQLGITESGRGWAEVAGLWGIESGWAVVSQPNSDGPSIAVANTRTTRSIVQVTMPSVAQAAGLVFRYTNQFNYWALTAAPGSGTWTISRVSQGETAVVGNLGPSQVDDNTTIAVRSDENSMDFFVDGTKVTSITSTASADGTFVGLIGRGPGTIDARWVNFVAIALAEPEESGG